MKRKNLLNTLLSLVLLLSLAGSAVSAPPQESLGLADASGPTSISGAGPVEPLQGTAWMFEIHQAPNVEEQFRSLGVPAKSTHPFAVGYGRDGDQWIGDLVPPDTIDDAIIRALAMELLRDKLVEWLDIPQDAVDALEKADLLSPLLARWAEALLDQIRPLFPEGWPPAYWKAGHYQGMARGNRPDGTPFLVLSRSSTFKEFSWRNDKQFPVAFDADDEFRSTCKSACKDAACWPEKELYETCKDECDGPLCIEDIVCYTPWLALKGCRELADLTCDLACDAIDVKFEHTFSLCALLGEVGYPCYADTPADLLVVDLNSRPKDGGAVGSAYYSPADLSTYEMELDRPTDQWTHPGGGQLMGFTYSPEQDPGTGEQYRAQLAFFGTIGWCNKQFGVCQGSDDPPKDAAIVILNTGPGFGDTTYSLRSVSEYLLEDDQGADPQEGAQEQTVPLTDLQNIAVTVVQKGSTQTDEDSDLGPEERVVFAHSYSGKLQLYWMSTSDLYNLLVLGLSPRLYRIDEWEKGDEEAFPDKPQNISFVQSTTGDLYLVTMANNPANAAYVSRVKSPIALFKITLPWDKAVDDGKVDVQLVSNHDVDLGPFGVDTTDYMGDFEATGTAYVGPDGRLYLYSAEHYPFGEPMSGSSGARNQLRLGELSATAPIYYAPPDQVADEGKDTLFDLGAFSAGGDTSGREWWVKVSWGDGTYDFFWAEPDTPLTPHHTYVDGPATHRVAVTVVDSDGYGCEGAFEVQVGNVAPTVKAGADMSIDEGSPVSLGPATFTDPGILDTHTATIDWGDTTAAEDGAVGQGSGSGAVSGSHIYADDGAYVVEVCVKDNDMSEYAPESCDTLSITVNNVAPTVETTTLNDETGARIPDDVPGVLQGLSLDLSATFHDAGTLDSHTATVNWGDGQTTAAAVSETPYGPPGSTVGMDGSVAASHIYAQPGDYVISLTVADDNAGVSLPALVPIEVLDPSGAIENALDDLLALLPNPNIASAIDKLRGDDGGADRNGALDMLAKANANAALEKIGQALGYLDAAEAEDPSLDLTYIKSLLTLSAKSVAVDLIVEAEAAASSNQMANIEEAHVLVEEGDGLLAVGDYVGAVGLYQEAVRKVQGIL